MSYLASYDLNENLGHSGSASLVIAFLFLATIGGVFSYRIYTTTDSEPEFELRRGKPIGGILLVIAVLILLQPAWLIISLLTSQSYFNSNLWELLGNSPEDEILQLLLTGTMIYETIQATFLIMLFLIFLERRTVFVKLTRIYIIVNLIYSLLFGLGYLLFGADRFDIGISGQTFLLVIIFSAFVFSYLRRSNRVEDTFVNTLNRSA